MRYLKWILLLLVIKANAQIPRNNSGMYEYSNEVTTNVSSPVLLKEKARKFFNQPFLVHWDSVIVADREAGTKITGKGYINVRAKQHGLSVGRNIPVSLQMEIEVKDSGYSYIIDHFAVTKEAVKYQFPLEEKPDEVKPMTYDQLLRSTHERVSFIIGWLKRYMEEGREK